MLLSHAVVKPNFRKQYQEQAEFTSPSYSASISGNFLKQLIEPEVALEKIAPLAGFHPQFSSFDDIYDAIKNVTEISGLPLTQKTGDGIASLLGFALNPINMALGGVGGLLAKGTIKGVSALAPEFLSKLAGKTITKLSTETVGSLGEKALTGASLGATSLLTQNLSESITPENKVNVSHLIKASSIAGGFGLALGVVPFAANVIRSKLFRRNETTLSETIALNQAGKDKTITPEEEIWYQAYQKNPNDPELIQQASEILKKNHPDIAVNPIDNKVNVSLLTSNDIKALQAVMPEELLAREGLNNTDALSGFIQKNVLDRLKQNPDLSEGFKGIVTELENKGEKDWHAFLSQVINAMNRESSADINTVKDYLKQRIENQLPAAQLTEQRIADAKEQLKHYQDSLKKQEEIHSAVKDQPIFKKYQEFKTQSKVFQDLIHCLQRNL